VKRLECLDGLRGMLAVYVMLGHMAPFAVLPAWLQLAVSHGGAAVDVFFILSGLVISESLDRTKGRAGPFLTARAIRIFPVFLLIFAFAVAIQPVSCGYGRMPWIGPDSAARTICISVWPSWWRAEILAHLTMTHGLLPNAVLPDVWVSFLGSAWSLSTEWQFYVLALVLYASGAGRLRTVLLFLAVVGVAWHGLVPEDWQFSRACLLNKGHFFALGVASAAVVRGERHGLVRYGFTLVACVGLCATGGGWGKLLPPLVWTLCLIAQMRPDTAGFRVLGEVLCSRTARWLGAISYCLYLVNEPIHKMLANGLSAVAGGDPAVFTVVWLPSAVVLPMLAAAWLHRHVEVPAMRWGRVTVHAPSGGRFGIAGR
jgi:peptidoglycan/LPS O-acetylase OafA/YrhL